MTRTEIIKEHNAGCAIRRLENSFTRLTQIRRSIAFKAKEAQKAIDFAKYKAEMRRIMTESASVTINS